MRQSVSESRFDRRKGKRNALLKLLVVVWNRRNGEESAGIINNVNA